LFNGREPDQERWNFDPIRLDSYSARVTFNPDSSFSVTAGAGYLKSPERLEPEESLVRVTASAMHGMRVGAEGQMASTFVWGANRHPHSSMTHSFLAETEVVMDRSNTFFARAELVQKSEQELGVPAAVGHSALNVGALQLGYIREAGRTHWATVGVGASGTLNFVPSSLEAAYGSRTPTGLFLFLRVRPFLEKRP
jgi:hypothetical protein